MASSNDEVEFVVELTRVAESTRELRPLLDWIVRRTTAWLSADDGSIKLSSASIYKTETSTGGGSWPQAITIGIAHHLADTQAPVASSDTFDDPRFPGFDRHGGLVRAVLAAPLKIENEIIGMLAVSQRVPGRRWTTREAQVLGIAAAHSAEAIQRVRLKEKVKGYSAQVAEYERDLLHAGELQASLLPRGTLRCGDWEVDGRVIMARRVGGDCFAYSPLGHGRVAVSIADVTGKGVPAALLVWKYDTLVRAFCDGRRALPEAFQEVSRSLIEQVPAGRSITSFFAEVDTRRHLLRFVRAGHCYPLLRHPDEAIDVLRDGDKPLGAFADTTFQEYEIPFVPGDALLLYTDGVTEAMNTRKDFFGEERLVNVWRQCRGRSATESVEFVLEEVDRFRNGAPQSDDVSVVAIAPVQG